MGAPQVGPPPALLQASLVNGLPARVAGSENLGQAPPLERGLPTRRRMLSGGPKRLIVRGSPGRGLQIAIFWVSACSVVRRAFLEPSRSVSCKSGLPPAPPCPCGKGQTAFYMAFLPVGLPASSNAVRWPEMAHPLLSKALSDADPPGKPEVSFAGSPVDKGRGKVGEHPNAQNWPRFWAPPDAEVFLKPNPATSLQPPQACHPNQLDTTLSSSQWCWLSAGAPAPSACKF